MTSAFIIGGTGQIGMGVARRLAREGWTIRLASRTSPLEGPWRHVSYDHSEPDALATVIGDGADLLMDCIAFDAADAEKLLSVQASVGHTIAVSSASVHRDEQGRTLDEARQYGFPHFPIPIQEDQPTVEPGPQTYSTRKVTMEMRLLDRAQGRTTILRPAAIHGPYSKHAREWWFVRRLLDGRQRIPLAYGGRSRFQTTSVAAIVETVMWAISGDKPPILNVADAEAPTTAEIGSTIMAVMGRYAEIVGLSDEPYPPSVGMSPWSVERPIVCSSLAPNAGTYAETAPDAVLWLIEATRNRDWRSVLPRLAAYPRELFDYEREDQLLSAL